MGRLSLAERRERRAERMALIEGAEDSASLLLTLEGALIEFGRLGPGEALARAYEARAKLVSNRRPQPLQLFQRGRPAPSKDSPTSPLLEAISAANLLSTSRRSVLLGARQPIKPTDRGVVTPPPAMPRFSQGNRPVSLRTHPPPTATTVQAARRVLTPLTRTSEAGPIPPPRRIV